MAGIDLSKLEDVDDGKKELAIKRNGKIMKPAKDVPVVTLEAVPVARSGQTQTGAVSTLGTTAVSAFGGAKLGIGAAVVQGQKERTKQIKEQEKTRRYVAKLEAITELRKEKNELKKLRMNLQDSEKRLEYQQENSRESLKTLEHTLNVLVDLYRKNMENYERSGYQNENIKKELDTQLNSINQYVMQLSQFR